MCTWPQLARGWTLMLRLVCIPEKGCLSAGFTLQEGYVLSSKRVRGVCTAAAGGGRILHANHQFDSQACAQAGRGGGCILQVRFKCGTSVCFECARGCGGSWRRAPTIESSGPRLSKRVQRGMEGSSRRASDSLGRMNRGYIWGVAPTPLTMRRRSRAEEPSQESRTKLPGTPPPCRNCAPAAAVSRLIFG